VKILVGDLNAKVGRENIFKPTIGNVSLHQVINDNDDIIVNFVTSKNLVVKRPMFPPQNIHKYTWTSPDGKTHKQTDHILIDIRVQCTVGGIFFYLSKAFDCVNHKILLSKLEHYGIRGTFGALINPASWRDIKELHSRMKLIPLTTQTGNLLNMGYHKVRFKALYFFFLLYLNDLPTVTAENAKLVLYADDTSFIITKPSPIEFADKLNKFVTNVNEWYMNNLPFLNFNKTTYLQF